MKVKCILEARGKNGKKVLQFSLNQIYEAQIDPSDGKFIIKDDNGNIEKFQYPYRMFKAVN